MPFVSSVRVGFGDDACRTSNGGCFRLCTRHASESASDEGHTGQVGIVAETQMEASSVEQGNGGAVNDALGTDVHVGTSRHLTILRHARAFIRS